MNYFFRKGHIAYMYEWMWERSAKQDFRLLDKALDFASASLNARNDRFGRGRYKLGSGSVGPLWPNFKRVEFYRDGTHGMLSGAGAFAGLGPLAVPVRTIARHPALWDRKRAGTNTTYLQLAERLGAEAWATISYSHAAFRSHGNVLRYPACYQKAELRGKVLIFNRVWPLITGSIPLAEAYEAMGVHADRVAAIDAVNGAMVDQWQRSATRYTSPHSARTGANDDEHSQVDNTSSTSKTYITYPYQVDKGPPLALEDGTSAPDPLVGNGTHDLGNDLFHGTDNGTAMVTEDELNHEDFQHGSFDSRDFQLLYSTLHIDRVIGAWC